MMKNWLRRTWISTLYIFTGLFLGSLGFGFMAASFFLWQASSFFWSVILAFLGINGLAAYIYVTIQHVRWNAKEIEREKSL